MVCIFVAFTTKFGTNWPWRESRRWGHPRNPVRVEHREHRAKASNEVACSGIIWTTT